MGQKIGKLRMGNFVPVVQRIRELRVRNCIFLGDRFYACSVGETILGLLLLSPATIAAAVARSEGFEAVSGGFLVFAMMLLPIGIYLVGGWKSLVLNRRTGRYRMKVRRFRKVEVLEGPLAEVHSLQCRRELVGNVLNEILGGDIRYRRRSVARCRVLLQLPEGRVAVLSVAWNYPSVMRFASKLARWSGLELEETGAPPDA